ncbi:MAG: hypothetical protein NTY07_20950 [Bacteroidia bacterium]|nr:hypothetical protein [Bacteroidia bacterium]
MELKLNIGLNQIIGLIRELPYNDKLMIKHQLDNDLIPKFKNSSLTLNQLLLAGPVMTEEGYNNYRELRKQFNKWTKKLSV